MTVVMALPMIIHELVDGSETHPVYQKLDVTNRERQLDFLKNLVEAAIQSATPFLSQTVIKALNFRAISCLHAYAGQYRPCDVTIGDYEPPMYFRIPSLMDDMVNRVNRWWTEFTPVSLAAYVLWRINWIHPFINGNGRTARAASYFVICAHAGYWMDGIPIFPERLKGHPEYYEALKTADAGQGLARLEALIAELLLDQDAFQPPQ